MSKSSDLDKTAKRYIIDSIDGSGYDLPGLKQDEDKINFLSHCFNSEAGWNIKRVGPLKAMTEWLQGLPSSCNIAFANHEILGLAKQWGSLSETPTEREEDKILANYWHFMANKTLQLFRSV